MAERTLLALYQREGYEIKKLISTPDYISISFPDTSVRIILRFNFDRLTKPRIYPKRYQIKYILLKEIEELFLIVGIIQVGIETMEPDITSNSDVVEPGQEKFTKYVSPPPPDLSLLKDQPNAQELKERIDRMIEKIGACRLAPQDGRIGLSFHLIVRAVLASQIRSAFGSMQFLGLERFLVKDYSGFLFEILDSNLADPAEPILAYYTSGKEGVVVYKTTKSEDFESGMMTTVPDWPVNQWRRVILCQGLSTVLKLYGASYGGRTYSPFPYLTYNARGVRFGDPTELAIELHLRCSKRLGSKFANPYRDQDNGFHIVFYEKIWSFEKSKNEIWKTGNLYRKTIDSAGGSFRRSAFTIFTKFERRYHMPESSNKSHEEPETYWTLILLTPSGFFQSLDNIDNSSKTRRDPFLREERSDPDWRNIGIQRCILTAELTSILHGMRLVVEQWERLYQHIEGLLHEDFMDPTAYVELLFDDENFSQSRLYFWVIGCLNEFQITIEDNIKQWTLFREARVEPYLEKSQGDDSLGRDSFSTSSEKKMGNQKKAQALAEEINAGLPFQDVDVPSKSESSASFDELRKDRRKRVQKLAREIDILVESLINCQSQFKHQLEVAQAFRDGLFNASALMESRASTRLGENVKLLTYVSIFYLPLAFCAALWAIPNITSSGTRDPFIITSVIVGLVTYIIVFNIGNVVNQLKRVYEPFRSRVIKQMCQQSGSKWGERTKRFESTFGPKRGDSEPSEWWIFIYPVMVIYDWLLAPFRKTFWWIIGGSRKIIAFFGNAFQSIRQFLTFPWDSTSNVSQTDSTSSYTQESV